MTERVINAERIEQIISVFGSFDENIKRIEQAFDIHVTNRGTELKVQGDVEAADKGVRVRAAGGRLVVDLHIAVTYGVNISAIVNSIINKVRYTVEEATGLEVAKVNVFVDSMKS